MFRCSSSVSFAAKEFSRRHKSLSPSSIRKAALRWKSGLSSGSLKSSSALTVPSIGKIQTRRERYASQGVGKQIAAYSYQPSDPDDAYLEREGDHAKE